MNTKIKIATVMLSLSCATMAVTMDDVGAVKFDPFIASKWVADNNSNLIQYQMRKLKPGVNPQVYFILHKKQLSSQAPYGHNKNTVRALECVVPDAGQNHLEAGGFHFSRVDDFFEFV